MRKIFFSPPSLRLNTIVIYEVVVLLLVSLTVLWYFSRDMLKKESMQDAEQTLEAAALQADNVLLSVEQSAGNIYWEMMGHLDKPERMITYCRKIVECNPYVMGCAIAFKPDFYPNKEQSMSYVRRKKFNSPQLISSETYGHKTYTERMWYREPMEEGKIGWLQPRDGKSADGESVITFCLPIRSNDEQVGVFAVDLSIDLLSQIVLSAKPTDNSYCFLLSNTGVFIVHPEREKMLGRTAFSLTENGANPALHKAIEAMLAGETDHKSFQRDGEDFIIFYKPFVRAEMPRRYLKNFKWSIACVYPIKDIAGPYQNLIIHVLVTAAVGLFLFFIFSRIVFKKQYKPLRKLIEATEDITEGNYDEEISSTRRNDEIGAFYQHFMKMQQALATHVNEQKELTATLEKHREELQEIYKQTLTSSDVKRNLLHNATNQMLPPSEAIANSVSILCNDYQTMSPQETQHEADTIRQQSDTILKLLDQMLSTSEDEERKEDSHE